MPSVYHCGRFHGSQLGARNDTASLPTTGPNQGDRVTLRKVKTPHGVHTAKRRKNPDDSAYWRECILEPVGGLEAQVFPGYTGHMERQF